MGLRMPPVPAKLTGWLIHIGARLTRPLTLGVRAVILDDAERVFLVRHSYVPGWHLPGGGVEAGETAPEALARETREECNIEIAGEPSLHGIFFNRGASRRDHVLVYVVREFRQIGVRAPDREIAEAGFFPRHAVPQGTTAVTEVRLAEVLDGRRQRVTW